MLYESNKEQVLDKVINNGKGKQLVVFYAQWCGPCKMYKGSLDELAEKNGVDIYRIDIDQHKDFASEAGVRSIPHTQFYVNGKLAKESLGYKPYEALLEEYENSCKECSMQKACQSEQECSKEKSACSQEKSCS
ncbi:thioredoxin family protein [Mycoplasma leonicaptivi]|uniref:thioredoxin family protein n=1 Tax=Mycoplasma leonicaptivi TaxID=36742 RepID=UPI000A03B546|nr:thioredoxin family protein [Mycoplasma leonicaptivi]